MPGRLEFEHEVENEAEVVIKDMEFGLVLAYGGDEIPDVPTKGEKPVAAPDKPAVSSKALPSSSKKPEKKEAEKTKTTSADVEMTDVSVQVAEEVAVETQEPSNAKQETEDSEGEQDTGLQPGMHLEDEEDLELKLATLEIYYEKLQRRAEVKDFIFDRALMDYKRVRSSILNVLHSSKLTAKSDMTLLCRCKKRKRTSPRRRKTSFSATKSSPRLKQRRTMRYC